jgi:hypothetical protein
LSIQKEQVKLYAGTQLDAESQHKGGHASHAGGVNEVGVELMSIATRVNARSLWKSSR